MKKLLIVFSFLMMAVLSSQASAANFNLGLINPSQTFGRQVPTGAFVDDYSFTVPTNNGTAASVTNSFAFATAKIANFQAWIDGNPLTLTSSISQQLLEGLFANLAANVTHILRVSGTSTSANSSYGGSIAVDVVTPIPAAVWLFGSALMGLIGVKRRIA